MVETSEGTLDIAALKVAELKEELSKRGLPTNGLKKDLAERLRGAVEAQAKVEDAPIPSAESTEEQPAVVEEDVGKDDAVQQTVSNSLKPSAEEIAVSSNAAEVVHAPVEGIQSEEPIANDQEELETNDVQIMPIASAGVQDGAKVADDEKRAFEADEVPMNVNEDRPNETNDRADRIGEDLAGADVEEVELGVDTEVDIDIPTANEEADVVDIPADIENTDVAMKDEEKKLTSYHHDGISPHSDPPLMLLPDKASAAKALSDPDRELRELSKPSKAVYISGLVRPLTLPSFKAKMEDYGALEEDDSIWLDGVKTHAYVTYQQVEAATKAMEDMSGTTYPPDTGREIQVQYIPSEIVKQCIFIEELAWQEERGKMELRARKSDQEYSLVYSLHRQEGIPISQRIEPKASSLHTVNQRNAPLAGRVQLGTGHHSSQARLEWGVGSSNGNTYDRYGRGSPQDYSRRDYRSVPGRRDDFGSSRDDRGGYRRADRGSSRADERVREVEARILAERQRGERPVHRDINRDRLRSPPYSNDRSYGAPSMNKERWSRDRDEDYTRSSYNDRRREYSPPPPRREYAESDRDEFGRDRHRRE